MRGVELAVVVSNRNNPPTNARGGGGSASGGGGDGILSKARRHGLQWAHVPYRKGMTREAYDEQVVYRKFRMFIEANYEENFY